MLAALLACSAALLAAGAPGVALAAGDLSAAQDRVDAAHLAVRTTVLAHAVADERDAAAVSAAAGRAVLPAADLTRTDQALAAAVRSAPTALRTALAGLSAARRTALAAGDPQHALTAYQRLDDALLRAAGSGTAPLSRAVDAASLEHALLVAALTGEGGQPVLVAEARAARAQEQAGLADFRAAAPPALVARYDRTVAGAAATEAERDTAALLAGPRSARTAGPWAPSGPGRRSPPGWTSCGPSRRPRPPRRRTPRRGTAPTPSASSNCAAPSSGCACCCSPGCWAR